MISNRVLILAGAFAAARLAAFFVIRAGTSFDARWQLAYLPLWAADFPLSFFYRFLPFPLPEAVLGPVWWFALVLLVARAISAVRRDRQARVPPN